MRAERAGYKALVVTVDAPALGKRLLDCRDRVNLSSHLSLASFSGTSVASSLVVGEDSRILKYTIALMDDALSWDAIDWLREVTKLPIVLKGIMTAEDAREALKHNIQGIIVSNHGGRQLDGVPATVRSQC